VSLSERDGGYLVGIADDGVGFSGGAFEVSPGHLGLASMRERAMLAGGWLRIEASSGGGTTIQAWIPRTPEPSAGPLTELGSPNVAGAEAA